MEKKLFAAALTAMTSLALPAATCRYWNVAEGDWGDASSWRGGNIPVSNEEAIFNNGTDLKVRITSDVVLGYSALSDRDDDLDPAIGKVLWYGSGTVTNTSSSICYVGNNRSLVIDGPAVYTRGGFNVFTNSVLEVRNGAISQYVGKTISTYGNASILLSGGIIHTGVQVKETATMTVSGTGLFRAKSLSVADGAKFILEGGTLQCEEKPSINADTFEFRSGLLRWYDGGSSDSDRINLVTQNYLVPKGKDSVLETRNTKTDGALFLTSANPGMVSFDGTMICTNNVDSIHPGLYFYRTDNSGLAGEGTLIADYVFSEKDTHTYILANKAIKLHYGFGTQSAGAVFDFPCGMEFYAWGDWNNTRGTQVPTMKFSGVTTFDTLDCMDGSTAHTVTLQKVWLYELNTLRVFGGGTVALALNGRQDEVENLVVGANTTLDLRGSQGVLRVRNLVMEAGARMLCDLDEANGFAIEVTGSETLSPTAEIKFTVGDDLMAGYCYPVYINGGTIPTANLSFENDSGYAHKTVEGTLYLKDSVDPGLTKTAREWVGSVSSSFKEVGNWCDVRDEAPYGGSDCFFGRDINPYVTFDFVRKGEVTSLRQYTFLQSAGPYVLSGHQLISTYGKESSFSIKSESDCPVLVNNFAEFRNSPGAEVLCMSRGSVQLLGGMSLIGPGCFWMRGDVRIGGGDIMNITNIVYTSNNSAPNKMNCLTILQDGVVYIGSGEDDFKPPTKLKVDGRMVVYNKLKGFDGAIFKGAGEVDLYDIDASADGTLVLNNGITLKPYSGWNTVKEENSAVARMAVNSGAARIGAACDWTYGPADGTEPTTEAQDRALTVARNARAVIDPGIYTITFTDPIVAEGEVVKEGAGALVLASEVNRMNSLKLKVGEVRIARPLSVGKLSSEGGTIALIGELAESVASGWTAVITADEVMGSVSFGDGFKTRIAAVNGRQVISVKAARGGIFIVR